MIQKKILKFKGCRGARAELLESHGQGLVRFTEVPWGEAGPLEGTQGNANRL